MVPDTIVFPPNVGTKSRCIARSFSYCQMKWLRTDDCPICRPATRREMVPDTNPQFSCGLEKAECPLYPLSPLSSLSSSLAEGDTRGNHLRDEARSAADQAWSFSGRLCVHRSIARISGYTVSHQPSGRAVLTRIHDNAAAFDLVRRCWPSA
jgi:hypothetical protein